MQTALHGWHTAHGARMVDFAGWDMPIQYTTIIDEHHAVRKHVGLFDISHMGRLIFEGPDSLDLIQHLYTNDAAAMKMGQVRYGLVCNEKGCVLDDVLVYRMPTSWMMVVNASNREKIVQWIERHKGGRNVRVTDDTLTHGMVAVQGPQAVALGERALAHPAWIGGYGTLPAPGALKYYYVQTYPAAQTGGPITVSRTGYTGEDGIEIIVPSERLPALCERLMEAAGESNVELKLCGLGARDTLRLESAMPLYGHELSEELDPFQVGLTWAVKMNKGAFLGRDSLAERQGDATLRQRVGLELEGKRIPRQGMRILSGSKEVGVVSSGTFSPTLERSIAMAFVDPGCTPVGTALEVDVRGKVASGRVVSMPFYKRKS